MIAPLLSASVRPALGTPGIACACCERLVHDRIVISRVPDHMSTCRRASIGLKASKITSGRFHPLNILLCVHLAFVLLFDSLGDAFRQDTSAVLGIAYGLLAVSAGFFKRHLERVLLVAAGAIAATWALSHLLLDGSFNRDLVSFSSAARSLFPFVAGVAIISWRDRL